MGPNNGPNAAIYCIIHHREEKISTQNASFAAQRTHATLCFRNPKTVKNKFKATRVQLCPNEASVANNATENLKYPSNDNTPSEKLAKMSAIHRVTICSCDLQLNPEESCPKPSTR